MPRRSPRRTRSWSAWKLRNRIATWFGRSCRSGRPGPRRTLRNVPDTDYITLSNGPDTDIEPPLVAAARGVILDDPEAEPSRTDLAEDRTILANERTFAGWMRTALACVAIG